MNFKYTLMAISILFSIKNNAYLNPQTTNNNECAPVGGFDIPHNLRKASSYWSSPSAQARSRSNSWKGEGDSPRQSPDGLKTRKHSSAPLPGQPSASQDKK